VRDNLEKEKAAAHKIWHDTSMSDNARKTAEVLCAELTIKIRDHGLLEPNSSGGPARAAAGTNRDLFQDDQDDGDKKAKAKKTKTKTAQEELDAIGDYDDEIEMDEGLD